MSDVNSSGTERDNGLKNPMRFSIRNRVIDIENCLRHPDFDEKQVTEIEIQDGQLYVHWEWSVNSGTDQEGINEATRGDMLEQAQAVQEAVTASMYYPVAHGEAEKLKQLIEAYENND